MARNPVAACVVLLVLAWGNELLSGYIDNRSDAEVRVFSRAMKSHQIGRISSIDSLNSVIQLTLKLHITQRP